MNTGNLIREKIYKLLYQKYKSLNITVLDRAYRCREYGEKEDKLKFVETIVAEGAFDWSKIVKEQHDTETIKLLEYLLNDDEPVRK